MDIVFLLVPLSLLIVFAIGAIFWWAVDSGQFDDLENQGADLISDDETGTIPPGES
jgi:cbb3-type cytochrome oxidase maturation protein